MSLIIDYGTIRTVTIIILLQYVIISAACVATAISTIYITRYGSTLYIGIAQGVSLFYHT